MTTLRRHPGTRGTTTALLPLAVAAAWFLASPRPLPAAATYQPFAHHGLVRARADLFPDATRFSATLLPTDDASPEAAAPAAFAAATRDADTLTLLVGGWPILPPGRYAIQIQGFAANGGEAGSLVVPDAVELAPRRIDVALVLDDSHSMRHTDPSRLRIEAARVFARIAATRGDVATLSIVGFSRRPRLLLPPSPPGDAAALDAALARLSASGSTDLDAALILAASELARLPADSRKVLVVLSDGRDEPGEYANAHLRCVALRWPIYTVGFSEDIDEATLRRIADSTGGTFHRADSSGQLAAIFTKIARDLHRNVSLGEWPAGEGTSVTIPVDDTVRSLSLTLLDQEPGAACSLIDPVGVSRAMACLPGARDDVAEIFAPAAGEWTLRGIHGHGILSVQAASDLELVAIPPADTPVRPGDPLALSCVLLSADGPVPGATLVARLDPHATDSRLPEWPDTPFPLRDDGQDGDIAPSDGVYALRLPAPAAGSGTLRFLATGHTQAGFAFERHDSLPLSVLDPAPPPNLPGIAWLSPRLPDPLPSPRGIRSTLPAPLPESRFPPRVLSSRLDNPSTPLPAARNLLPLPATTPPPLHLSFPPPTPIGELLPPPEFLPVAPDPSFFERYNWLHILLLVCLLALIAFFLVHRMTKLKGRHGRMLKYFVGSVAAHALLLLLTLDLLVQVRAVELEDISPGLAVSLEALEGATGVRLAPPGPIAGIREQERQTTLERVEARIARENERRRATRHPDLPTPETSLPAPHLENGEVPSGTLAHLESKIPDVPPESDLPSPHETSATIVPHLAEPSEPGDTPVARATDFARLEAARSGNDVPHPSPTILPDASEALDNAAIEAPTFDVAHRNPAPLQQLGPAAAAKATDVAWLDLPDAPSHTPASIALALHRADPGADGGSASIRTASVARRETPRSAGGATRNAPNSSRASLPDAPIAPSGGAPDAPVFADAGDAHAAHASLRAIAPGGAAGVPDVARLDLPAAPAHADTSAAPAQHRADPGADGGSASIRTASVARRETPRSAGGAARNAPNSSRASLPDAPIAPSGGAPDAPVFADAGDAPAAHSSLRAIAPGGAAGVPDVARLDLPAAPAHADTSAAPAQHRADPGADGGSASIRTASVARRETPRSAGGAARNAPNSSRASLPDAPIAPSGGAPDAPVFADAGDAPAAHASLRAIAPGGAAGVPDVARLDLPAAPAHADTSAAPAQHRADPGADGGSASIRTASVARRETPRSAGGAARNAPNSSRASLPDAPIAPSGGAPDAPVFADAGDAPAAHSSLRAIAPGGAAGVPDVARLDLPAAPAHAATSVAPAQHRADPGADGGSASIRTASVARRETPRLRSGTHGASRLSRAALPEATAGTLGTAPPPPLPDVEDDAPPAPGPLREIAGGDFAISIGEGGRGSVRTTIGMARYGGDWDCARSAMMFLGHQLKERTRLAFIANDSVIALDSPDLSKLPFVYLTGHNDFRFTDAEIANLRAYLHAGGHLWADDSTHFQDDDSFDTRLPPRNRPRPPRCAPRAARPRIRRPSTRATTSPTATKAMPFPPATSTVSTTSKASRIGGRVAVVYTRNDYGDGLNIDAHTHPLQGLPHRPLSPAEMQEGATRMGINLAALFPHLRRHAHREVRRPYLRDPAQRERPLPARRARRLRTAMGEPRRRPVGTRALERCRNPKRGRWRGNARLHPRQEREGGVLHRVRARTGHLDA
jgi:hypothetical protein